MKKSLVALAVLAATGAASAQSSVTIYGQVDAYVGSVKDTITSVTNVSQTAVNSSGLFSSRWGFKGSEDLGDGLKANFVLEGGFSPDTGATAGDLFGRKATVGLSGNFGAVNLGRDYTAYFTLRNMTNNTADSNAAITNTVWANGGDYTIRTNNSVRFDSQTYSGISGSVAYAFGENKTSTLTSTDTISANVKYAQGPVLVGFAHQTQKAALATESDTKFNLIAGSYDLGTVKLNAGLNNVSRTSTDESEYQVGLSAPLGATTLYAGFAGSTVENKAGVEQSKRTGYNLAATYSLSKRTTAYAAYMNAEIKNTTQELKAVAIGVHHAF